MIAMEGLSPEFAAFTTRVSASFHQETDQLHALLTVEMDKLRAVCLAVLTEHLKHVDAILREATRAAFPHHTELLQALAQMLQKPPLEYRLEAIIEAIKSKIVVSEPLRRLRLIPSTDFPLLLTMHRNQAAVLHPELRPVRFELTEASVGRLGPAVPRSNTIRDWLCRNCMKINPHRARNCSLCGYQSKDQQAEG